MSSAPPREIFQALDSAFDPIRARLLESPAPATLLFSGGVDSSLLAHELRPMRELELLVVGRAGSPDLAQATSAAAMLGRTLTSIEITGQGVRSTVSEFSLELIGAQGPYREVAVAFALAVPRASQRRVLTAQGVDELFLGYHHFRDLAPSAAAARARQDLAQLQTREWPRAVRIAKRSNHELEAPFLDPDWIRAAQTIPVEARQPHPEVKFLFRSWAEHRGLPTEIAHRPKRAMQYGSRIHQLLGGS
ncbi:MAG: asparagine synthase C-terminal domain-containing protein [Thermoplasmata archaeon]